MNDDYWKNLHEGRFVAGDRWKSDKLPPKRTDIGDSLLSLFHEMGEELNREHEDFQFKQMLCRTVKDGQLSIDDRFSRIESKLDQVLLMMGIALPSQILCVSEAAAEKWLKNQTRK